MALLLFLGLTQIGYTQNAVTSSVNSNLATACKPVTRPGWTPYRVQMGDTLAGLAQQHGVHLDEIRQQNCLTAEQIQPDQLLLLPATSAPAPALPTTAGFTPTPRPSPTATPVQARVATSGSSQPVVRPGRLSQSPRPNRADLSVTQPTSHATPFARPITTGAVLQNFDANQLSAFSVRVLRWVRAIILLDLLVIVTALTVIYLALRRRATVATGQTSPRLGYLLFLLTGVLFGLFAFPVLQPPIPTDWFAAVRVTGSVSLVVGLAIKELMITFDQRWRAVKTTLNLALIPLWMIFLLTIVTQILEPR